MMHDIDQMTPYQRYHCIIAHVMDAALAAAISTPDMESMQELSIAAATYVLFAGAALQRNHPGVVSRMLKELTTSDSMESFEASIELLLSSHGI